MERISRILSLTALALLAVAAPAKDHPRLGCGAAAPTLQQAAWIEYDAWQRARQFGVSPFLAPAAASAPGIPVAFHVLHDGPIGYVSMERIQAQIESLNAAFAPATFVLASVDYTDDAAWFDMGILSKREREAKQALQVDAASTLNIYTCQPRGRLLGWAYLPLLAGYLPMLDGVVVHHDAVIDGGFAEYAEGDSVIHEVGHWAGLFHTFQLGCLANGDLVGDTPLEKSPGYGCEPGRDTCPADPGLDPIDNFMDYSDDACAERFTPGQFFRMAWQLAIYRPVVWNSVVQGMRQ